MKLEAHPFSLRQLQYAVAVADLLSFRKAAERCHVSQPSLSAQVALLEDVLGVRLFERDKKRVLPTPAGKELVERARRVLVDADELAAAAQRASDPFEGTLRIGVIPTISPYLLPAIAPALRRRYPRLSVIWTEDKTPALVEGLERASLDAALLALEAEVGDVEHAVIARDPFVLAAAPEHPLGATGTPASEADLRDENVLLLDDGHCFREQVLSVCAAARANELDFRATSLSTLAQMVAGGGAVTLLPLLSVPTEAARSGLHVRPFAAPAPNRTIALVWRKRSPLGAAFQQLAELFRSAYPGEEAESPAPAAKPKRRAPRG